MPIIKSAIKRAKQNEERRKRLLPVRTFMKTMMRKLTDMVKAGKKTEAEKMIPEVHKAIDMAAKKNVIHRKNAARKKARMSKAVAGMK